MSKPTPLTVKQETFCIEVVKQPTYSDAYRIAYNTENFTPKSVNEKASELMADIKIISRVKELKKALEDKELYTLSESVKRDLKLIGMYENALSVLSEDVPQEVKLKAAERVIKNIGAGGYSSAQDRLSKQHGFYEKDNKQGASNPAPSTISFINMHKKEE